MNNPSPFYGNRACQFTAYLLWFYVFSTSVVAGAAPDWYTPAKSDIEARVNSAIDVLAAPTTPETVAGAFRLTYNEGQTAISHRDVLGERRLGLPSLTVDLKDRWHEPNRPIGRGDVMTFNSHGWLFNGAYFRGQILIHRYYADFRIHSPPENDGFWQTLIRQQPWLQWIPAEARYVARIGHVAEGVLATYERGEVIPLYRGTVEPEALLIRTLKDMIERGRCEPGALRSLGTFARTGTQLSMVIQRGLEGRSCATVADELIAAITTDLSSKRLNFGALFYSAEFEYAGRFAKGRVIEVRFTREELEALAADESLYVGTETGSEFAFLGTSGLRALIRAYHGETEGQSDTYFQGDGLAKHPIWQRP